MVGWDDYGQERFVDDRQGDRQYYAVRKQSEPDLPENLWHHHCYAAWQRYGDRILWQYEHCNGKCFR